MNRKPFIIKKYDIINASLRREAGPGGWKQEGE